MPDVGGNLQDVEHQVDVFDFLLVALEMGVHIGYVLEGAVDGIVAFQDEGVLQQENRVVLVGDGFVVGVDVGDHAHVAEDVVHFGFGADAAESVLVLMERVVELLVGLFVVHHVEQNVVGFSCPPQSVEVRS